MAEHPIQNLMNVTMDKIRQMVDSNTIVLGHRQDGGAHHHR